MEKHSQQTNHFSFWAMIFAALALVVVLLMYFGIAPGSIVQEAADESLAQSVDQVLIGQFQEGVVDIISNPTGVILGAPRQGGTGADDIQAVGGPCTWTVADGSVGTVYTYNSQGGAFDAFFDAIDDGGGADFWANPC